MEIELVASGHVGDKRLQSPRGQAEVADLIFGRHPVFVTSV